MKYDLETTFYTENNSAPATIGPNKGKIFARYDTVVKSMHLKLTQAKALELAERWNAENAGNPRAASYRVLAFLR